MTRNWISGVGFATASLLVASSAYAIPMLRVSSGGASCTLTDEAAAAVCVGGGTNAGGDLLSGMAGAVTGSFSVGVFTINVSTGVTKPAGGSATNPTMDLNTVNASFGAGTVTIEFTEDFFGPATGNPTLMFGGTASGTGTYTVYTDAANTPFATTTLVAAAAFGPGAYSGTVGGGAIGGSPFSLTQIVTYTHGGGFNISSGDHLLTVPEPGVLFLLGGGLLALGFARRRLA